MNKRFITPDLTDGRIVYAADYLEQSGCEKVEQLRNADFVLLGVNPKARFLEYSLPIFAGNVEKTGVLTIRRTKPLQLKTHILPLKAQLHRQLPKAK